MQTTRDAILVLCTGNSARSQMAEGLLRRAAGDRFDIFSAGTKPSSLRAEAIAVMAEIGIDIHEEFPKPWTDAIVRAVDMVISMGCGDVCPIYPGKRFIDWDLDDPEGRDLIAVRVIRDEIRGRVEELVTNLGVASSVG